MIDAANISRPISIDKQGNLDFGTTVQDALKLPVIKDIADATGKLLAFDGDMMILSIIVPILMSVGTIFIVCMDIGVLVTCLMLSFTLLGAIVDRGMLAQWFKSFWAYSLINVAYKIIVSSIAFAMLAAGFTDVLTYALIAGLGAPLLAINVVSGNNLGILSGVGSAASRLIGR